MNIYFACSITGGREDEEMYDRIVKFLMAAGHEVPSAVFAVVGGEGDENEMSASEVFRRDVCWIEACDLLIAEVSTPSHGVGFEIGYALNLGKPVICLHRRNVKISKMISGNPHSELKIFDYADWVDLHARIADILDGDDVSLSS